MLKNEICFFDEAKLIVSSYDEDLINEIVTASIIDKTHFIGKNQIKISRNQFFAA